MFEEENLNDSEVRGAIEDSVSEYLSIKEAFEARGELSEEQLDVVADIAVDTLKSILNTFDESECTIEEYVGDEGELILNVCEGNLAVLIGRYGRVLDALQTLTAALVTKRLGFHFPISVDIESYKTRRKEKVITIARNMARKALSLNKEVALKPMSAYERRIVHTTLVDNVDVDTHSEGHEPYRYVVIKPR